MPLRAVLLISLLAHAAFAEIPQTVSQDAPDRLVLRDLSGAEKRLSEYRGAVVVLNFWATWCIPCREEMPLLQKTQQRYADRGVVVIGASADDESTQGQILPFIQKLGVTFPIWTEATTEHMHLLGLGDGLPVTAIIDQEGRLAFRILGIVQRKELEQRLDYLLAVRREPPPAPLVDRISAAVEEGKAHPRGAKHEGEENHHHGGVSIEGASTVPS